MFTGIIQEIGEVLQIQAGADAKTFTLKAPKSRPLLKIGDSIACNGVCLTATQITANGFTATAVAETLAKTNLGQWKNGISINLELAATPQTPLGGHYVMGHIDGVVEVLRWREMGGAGGGKELTVGLPKPFAKYCVAKGSFGLNGVSLTIAKIENTELTFALIPHTLEQTNLGKALLGDTFNFEVDILGKYVEKLLRSSQEDDSQRNNEKSIQKSQIEKWGYGF